MSANARSFLSETLSAGIEASRGALQSTQGLSALQGNLSNGIRCSRLTSSLQQKGSMNRNSCRETQELQAILQNTGGANTGPATTLFGVSPPVRTGWAGGAANPIGHDTTWARSAYSASHTNLQALRELESSGTSFLRGDLVVGSPEFGGRGVTPMDTCAAYQPKAMIGTCNPMLPFQCHVEYYAV